MLRVGDNFRVSDTGELFANAGKFSGTIEADQGIIGGANGWNIGT
jgi:hypothetical protein